MKEDIEKARVLPGVTPTATYGEIRRAYRVIIAACHPDRAGLDAWP
jgi:curved DNA-binding protein CbpA